MFKLNFKETFKDLVKDNVNSVLDEVLDKTVNKVVEEKVASTVEEKTEVALEKVGPLHTDKYLELIELINLNTKAALAKTPQPKTNIFSAKSVITVSAFLLTSVLVQLDVALTDNKVSTSEGVGIAVALIGAASTIAARGAEGKTGVYTPHGLSGLNKEDYYDANFDGIDDKLQ